MPFQRLPLVCAQYVIVEYCDATRWGSKTSSLIDCGAAFSWLGEAQGPLPWRKINVILPRHDRKRYFQAAYLSGWAFA